MAPHPTQAFSRAANSRTRALPVHVGAVYQRGLGSSGVSDANQGAARAVQAPEAGLLRAVPRPRLPEPSDCQGLGRGPRACFQRRWWGHAGVDCSEQPQRERPQRPGHSKRRSEGGILPRSATHSGGNTLLSSSLLFCFSNRFLHLFRI